MPSSAKGPLRSVSIFARHSAENYRAPAAVSAWAHIAISTAGSPYVINDGDPAVGELPEPPAGRRRPDEAGQ